MYIWITFLDAIDGIITPDAIVAADADVIDGAEANDAIGAAVAVDMLISTATPDAIHGTTDIDAIGATDADAIGGSADAVDMLTTGAADADAIGGAEAADAIRGTTDIDAIGATDADAIGGSADAVDMLTTGATDADAIGGSADPTDVLVSTATSNVIGAADVDAIGGAKAADASPALFKLAMQFNALITGPRAGPALLPLLYIGSSYSLRDIEGHSFSRPVSNLMSHLFSPLASKMVPSSCCLFHVFTWLPSGLQRDGKNDP